MQHICEEMQKSVDKAKEEGTGYEYLEGVDIFQIEGDWVLSLDINSDEAGGLVGTSLRISACPFCKEVLE